MVKKKMKRPKLGIEFALISQRNRIFVDKKKKANKEKCRRKNVKLG